MKELTTQQKEFCRLCVIQGNKSEAYRQAGLLTDKQNPKYVNRYADNLYRKKDIQTYVRGLQAKIDKVDEKLEQDFVERTQKQEKAFDIKDWFRGVVTGDITVNGEPASMGERIQAGKVYAQMDGKLTNKTEVSGDIVIDVVFDDE